MNSIPKPYLDFIYPNKNNHLPIPTKLEQLRVVYLLPNFSDLYDEWSFYPSMEWIWDYDNPNKAIPLGDVLFNELSWMTWGPYPMIWKNPFNPVELGRNVKGIELNKQRYVEVNHKVGDMSKGTWFTINPGSGMFFEIGDPQRVLVTRNKISALVTLLKNKGESNPVQKIVDKYGETFSWNGWDGTTNYRDQKQYIADTFGITTLNDLLTNLIDNKDPSRIGIEWIANCPVIDNWSYDLAKEQGYDMIEYYCSAYNGFWSDEFVWIGEDDDSEQMTKLAETNIQSTLGYCTSDMDNVLACKFNEDEDVKRDEFTGDCDCKIVTWKTYLFGILLFILLIFMLFVILFNRNCFKETYENIKQYFRRKYNN